MKLHRIELTNFRGVDRLVLGDLPDTGVVVVHGPNERGKSSIAEAVNLVLTNPAKTSRKNVRAVLPAGSTEPAEVKVDLTLDGHRFTVEKKYTGTASGKALVTVVSPVREEHRDKAAEDWLDERVRNAGVRDLWTAFTAEQGVAPNELALENVSALSQALEQETRGTAVDDEALLKKIREEADRYYTPAWKHTKAFAATVREPDELEERLTVLRKKRRELDGAIDRIEEGHRRLRDLDRRIPELRDEEIRATGRADAARRVSERESTARDRVNAASRELVEATRAAERRDDLIRKLAERKRQWISAVEAVDEADAAGRSAAERLATAGEEVSRLTSSRDLIRDTLRLARHDHDTRRRREDARAAGERLARIDELEKKLTDAHNRAAQFTVTSAQLETLLEAVNEARTAEALLAAESVNLRIRADESRDIIVDGESVSLSEPVALTVTGDTVLRIDGVEVTVAPPAGNDAAEESLARRAEVGRLLAEMAVDDVDQAREQVKQREAAENELAVAQQRLADATADVDRAADAALVRQVEEESVDRAELWNRDEPIPDDLPDRVTELEEELRRVEDDLAVAVAGRDAVKKSDTLERRHRALAAEELAKAEVDRAEAELREQREETSDEELSARVKEQSETVARLEADAAALAEELRLADPDGAAEDLAAVTSALEDARNDLTTWNITVATVQGKVDDAIGLDDQIRVLADRLANAREVASSELERADALKLLHDTLSRARDEMREEYQEPLREKLRQLARPVFGKDVDFTLDQSLSIIERTVDGTSIPFEGLSGGAKEQLDILTRLAAASLIDGGAAAPVILDDALGFSDRTRLDQMNRAITRAGKHSQVLVLTCDVERYSRINARREDISLLQG